MSEIAEQLELPLVWPSGHSPVWFKHMTGKTVRCVAPVGFWTDDWHDGMRERVYVGTLCSCHRGGWCLQPPPRNQGVDRDLGQCFSVTPEMTFEILPGKPGDY